MVPDETAALRGVQQGVRRSACRPGYKQSLCGRLQRWRLRPSPEWPRVCAGDGGVEGLRPAAALWRTSLISKLKSQAIDQACDVARAEAVIDIDHCDVAGAAIQHA